MRVTTGLKRPKIERVAVVVNPLSGSAGPDAAAEAERILAEHGIQGTVRAPDEQGLEACLREEMAGPNGPLVAPLPGGTMNMLPKALYGELDWKAALAAILTDGVEKKVSGGEVEGRNFYVAAILGSPALWAQAR